jgi:hypothetical protein
MTNITLDGLPAKTGTVSDAGIIHYREGGVDKKMTVADFLIKISEEYSADINSFLASVDKAAARIALGVSRRTTVNNVDYTVLTTDKVIAQTGTMSAARTFSLPSAASFPAGEELIIIDQSGTITPTNKIIVTRNGSNTIDGATSKDITAAYGFLRLICNGIDSWKIVNVDPIVSATTSVPGIVELLTNAELQTGTDTTRAATAAAILSLFTSSTLSTDTCANLPVNSGSGFSKIMIQAGTMSAGAGFITETLAQAFPNAFLFVIPVHIASSYRSYNVDILSLSQVRAEAISSASTSTRYLAFGY